jgi:hypothetical protein
MTFTQLIYSFSKYHVVFQSKRVELGLEDEMLVDPY